MQSLTPREAQVRRFVEAADLFDLDVADIEDVRDARPPRSDYYDGLRAAAARTAPVPATGHGGRAATGSYSPPANPISSFTAQQVAIIEDFTAAFVAGLRVQGLIADMSPQDIGRLRDRAIARIEKMRSTP